MPAPYDSSPAVEVAAVTPHDSTNFTECRALYIGTGGNVSVVAANGGTAVLKNVPSGTLLPLRARRVNATGTTATDIVAWY